MPLMDLGKVKELHLSLAKTGICGLNGAYYFPNVCGGAIDLNLGANNLGHSKVSRI